MHTSPQVLLGLVTLTIVVLTRLRPRAVRARRMVTAPVIVVLVGAFLLVPWLGAPAPGAAVATIGVAVVDIALTVGLGIARGVTVKLDVDVDGVVRSRYTGLTVMLWVVSVALRFGLAEAGSHLGAMPAVTEGSVLLTLGFALLTQNLVVMRAAARARRSTKADTELSAESTLP